MTSEIDRAVVPRGRLLVIARKSGRATMSLRPRKPGRIGYFPASQVERSNR
jgi:hypothetical protein